MKKIHYIVNMGNVDGTQTKSFLHTIEEALHLVRRTDHEGATWDVEEVTDITEEIQRAIKRWEELPR